MNIAYYLTISSLLFAAIYPPDKYSVITREYAVCIIAEELSERTFNESGIKSYVVIQDKEIFRGRFLKSHYTLVDHALTRPHYTFPLNVAMWRIIAISHYDYYFLWLYSLALQRV